MLKTLAFILMLGGCVDYTAHAIELLTIEKDCTFNTYYAKSSAGAGVTSSTHAITGIGLSYAIKASTDNAVGYFISFPTKTYSTPGVDPSSVTTQRVTVIAGDVLSSDFKALTVNPQFVIDGLSAPGTAYIWVDYCEKRK